MPIVRERDMRLLEQPPTDYIPCWLESYIRWEVWDTEIASANDEMDIESEQYQ